MLRTLLVILLLLAPLGCGDDFEPPLVAGKAVLTLGAQQFLLDTGNGGKIAVAFDEDNPRSWYTDCRIKDGEFHVMIFNDIIREKGGLWGVMVRTALNVAQEDVNVFVDLGDNTFNGVCQLKHTTTREKDPYEAELSAEACTVRRPGEGSGPLHEARFDALVHAKQCFLPDATKPTN